MAKQNINKDRKSESSERFEQAENAGRFAGNDADAKAAKEQSTENMKQDTASRKSEKSSRDDRPGAAAGRGSNQSQDFAGEAQNVEDDGTGRLENEEVRKSAAYKSTEGIRQGRDEA